ncbi:MAG: response regulator [Verrucomicrobia bacterium]|nr:response regulator [Verrucomicrobiota bacterium]
MNRVLVIDDESSVRTAIRLLLEHVSCHVDEAQHGREGLKKARRNRPDLILCDLNMPVMDGFETLTQVRADPVVGGGACDFRFGPFV